MISATLSQIANGNADVADLMGQDSDLYLSRDDIEIDAHMVANETWFVARHGNLRGKPHSTMLRALRSLSRAQRRLDRQLGAA